MIFKNLSHAIFSQLYLLLYYGGFIKKILVLKICLKLFGIRTYVRLWKCGNTNKVRLDRGLKSNVGLKSSIGLREIVFEIS